MARLTLLLLAALSLAAPTSAAWGAKKEEVAKAGVTTSTDDKVSVVKREESYDDWHAGNEYWCALCTSRPRADRGIST